MNRALLDTDVLSEILRGRNSVILGNAARYREVHGRFTVSSVTVMEMVKGFHKLSREDRIQALLARLQAEEVLAFDQVCGEIAGRIHADLERTGQPIGWADTTIAAIASRHGLDLITGNTRHYERLPTLGYPLTIHDWRT